MKLKINRLLTAGKYNINFEVSEFTPEESAKMSSFGVPHINLRWISQNTVTAGKVPLTSINKGFNMQFGTPQEAKDYEQTVIIQIQTALENLRKVKDDFSSTIEVAL